MDSPDRSPNDTPDDASENAMQTVLSRYPTGPAPVEALMRRGRQARRRRTRRLVVAAGCAAALVAGGAAFAVGTSGTDSTVVAKDPNTAADTARGQDGQPVGLGRVAITVPSDWTVEEPECNNPTDKSVYFPAQQRCTVDAPVVSSIAVTSTEPDGVLKGARDRGETLDGHPVFEGPRRCATQSDDIEPGAPLTNSRRQCTLTVGVPDLDAWFRIVLVGDDAESVLDTIRDSLRVLPDTQVAVPPVGGNGLDTVVARLRALGLNPVVDRDACGPTAACPIPVITKVGRVVDVGSDVDVTTATTNGASDDAADATDAVPGPSSCAPGTIPMINYQDLAEAQTRTAPTPEQALQDLLPGTDLSTAIYEPFGSPVWVRLGGDTYIVQANTPGNWYAAPATFDGCHQPK